MKSFWIDAFNWWNRKRSENTTPSATEILYTVCRESTGVVSDSPGLVDFAIGLVNSVLNLPNGQVKYLRNSTYRRTVKSILLIKKLWALVEMTFGLVNANFY